MTIPYKLPEVRIVEASAGSGKTFALAKRYIQLLLSLPKESPVIRQILAITFTNKSALEMKERILSFLKKMALGKLSDIERQEILDPLGLNEDEVKARAFVLMDEIIRHYNFFQVQTIDSFINALLSGCAFKIGLSSKFKIRTKAEEYLEYSLDELIDQAFTNPDLARHLEEFVNNYLYLEERSGWFPRKDLLGIIGALYNQFNNYAKEFKGTLYSVDDLIKNKRTILKLIKEFNDNRPEGLDKRFVTSLDKFFADDPRGFDVDNLSLYFAREEIPVVKGHKVPKPTEKLWKSIHSSLKQLCIEEAFSLYNPYINLFSIAMENFRKIAAKDDVLFLSELNREAGKLFDEERVTVEELYYRLATRFRHYLVDEFQDTSRLQWHNLEQMVEEALSTGGSLFYVGDRKQAIYSFRGGDVDLFDDVKGKFNAFNVKTEVLGKNFRSQKEIIEFNNAIFSIDNLKRFIRDKEEDQDKNKPVFNQEDLGYLERCFGHAKQEHRPEFDKGLVRIEYIDAKNKEGRDELTREKVLELLRNLRQRFSLSDIAILTRNNKEVEAVTNWLLEEGIEAESERTTNIKENQTIEELVSLLTFLDSPIDNLAFSKFILSGIFLNVTGRSLNEIQEFIISLRGRLKQEEDFYLYTEFRRVFKKEWEVYFDDFFKNVGLYPLYELLVSIYSRFEVLKNAPDNQGYLMHFLNLVKKQEEDYPDLSSFLEFYEILEGEECYVPLIESDAVKVLTIHKSKGLEFPVVILPFLSMDVQVKSRSAEKNQQSYVLRVLEDHMELLRLKEVYYRYSDKLFEIYSRHYRSAFFTELNNIYVALTRAQNEMYAFIPDKAGSSKNDVRSLIPPELFNQGKESQYPKKEEKEKPNRLSSPKFIDWIEFLKEEFASPNEVFDREKVLKGEIIHKIFSFVGDLAGKDKELVLEEAIALTQNEYQKRDDWDEFGTLAQNVLKHKEFKKFFESDGAQVLCEKEIVDVKGRLKRIDRLIVFKDEVWVVDYKSSAENKEKNTEQVKEYLTALKDLYPKHKLKGFLIFLDELVVEEV